MSKPDIRGALGASLKAEEQSIKGRFEQRDPLPQDRFERAEAALHETAPSVAAPPGVIPSSKLLPPPGQPRPNQPRRVIRDSFTAPKPDYDRIAALKNRCLGLGTSVTKSEVLRAGLAALCAMPDDELLRLMQGLEKVKTGRPQPI